jgi:hypothetical protein
MARQCISSTVINTFAVHNPVLQTSEFGEYLLLLGRMQTLIRELGQALLICQNHKLLELQIGMLRLHN